MAGMLGEFFDELPDHRREQGKRHSAEAIVTIALLGTLCGADDCEEMVDVAQAKQEWLETFLELPHGIPSPDTIERFLAGLEPRAFTVALVNWTAHFARAFDNVLDSDLIAIDGKTLRRSHDRDRGKSPLHLVSAWCRDNSLLLGQIATDAHSNEITAIPRLLEMLALKGTVVSIDAMGTQREIAQQILDAKADYVLALKGNQTTLCAEVGQFFRDAFAREAFDRPIAPLPHTRERTVGKAHGRLETRTAYCVSDIEWLAAHKWPGLASVICVRSTRRIGVRETTECRYFLSSLNNSNPARLLSLIRGHWSIENSLHWSLDMTFNEDRSRLRGGHAAKNLAGLRRASLSILKQETTFKASLRRKRLRCLSTPTYLQRVLKAQIN